MTGDGKRMTRNESQNKATENPSSVSEAAVSRHSSMQTSPLIAKHSEPKIPL